MYEKGLPHSDSRALHGFAGLLDGDRILVIDINKK